MSDADNLDPRWNWIETRSLSGVTRFHKTTCRHLEVVPVEVVEGA